MDFGPNIRCAWCCRLRWLQITVARSRSLEGRGLVRPQRDKADGAARGVFGVVDEACVKVSRVRRAGVHAAVEVRREEAHERVSIGILVTLDCERRVANHLVLQTRSAKPHQRRKKGTRASPAWHLQEKAKYCVPVTAEGSLEQLSSNCANDVLVDVEDVTVTVAVGRDERSWSASACAVFAMCASTPVPAARPMTAAERSAMTTLSTNTKAVHPHIVPLLLLAPWRSSGPRAPSTGPARNGDGETWEWGAVPET